MYVQHSFLVFCFAENNCERQWQGLSAADGWIDGEMVGRASRGLERLSQTAWSIFVRHQARRPSNDIVFERHNRTSESRRPVKLQHSFSDGYFVVSDRAKCARVHFSVFAKVFDRMHFQKEAACWKSYLTFVSAASWESLTNVISLMNENETTPSG